jgi:phage major head subunit gpT-like protein
MIINAQNLSAMFDGFNIHFNNGFAGAETHWATIAMKVTSSSRDEKYGWMGQVPGLREWIGDRIIKNLALHDWTIKNRKFEDTIAVPREDIEDDRYGVVAPLVSEMGRAAAEHPDKLTFELLASGFTSPCYDGQNFFDTDHPVGSNGGDFPITSVSNMQAGAEPAWFLLDTTRAIKPLVYQERSPARLTQLNQDSDENVFMRDEYLYGVRARSNAGFGLWQLAFASQAELTPANYEAARAAMMSLKGDEGRVLGIKPTVLVAPPSLEGKVMRLLNNGTRIELVGTPPDDVPVAVQNEWAGTAKPIVTAWLL